MRSSDLLEILRRDVVEGARSLLGATLVRGPMRARIVETEAYRGLDDPACHAFGKTRMKNMALFSRPGNSYIYFNYGCHWMLNVVAHREGEAAAVLIRAAEPIAGIEQMIANRPRALKELLNGPGKLTQALRIGPEDNDVPLFESGPLQIVPPEFAVSRIVATQRVGIALGKWHDVPWRFIDEERLGWSSRPRPGISAS